MESVSDLFGKYRLIKKGKTLNERATVLEYFVEQGFTDKNNNRLTPAYIGRRLSHYRIDDLYALKSAYKDRLDRNGKLSAIKYWWYITKTT